MTLLLPTAAIDAHALPRDRASLDPAALTELQNSIATEGLRQPIEVWRLTTPRGPHQYGLISGLRRLTATRHLAALRPGTHQTIPAFLRTPADIPAALAAMISENEIRADPSPWDRGRILVEVVTAGHFETLDAAVKSLHPNASRQKRARLRASAAVVEELEGLLTTPDQLIERQILRLAASLRGGFVELIEHVLRQHRSQTLQTQWSALLPVLIEAERGEQDTPETSTSPARPRRMLHLKQGLTIWREETPNGYALRFSGELARRGGLMDDVMDEVERWFQPGFGK